MSRGMLLLSLGLGLVACAAALRPRYEHDRVKRDITSPPAPAPVVSACKTQTSCRCEFENGTYIDMSALANDAGKGPRFDHVLSTVDNFYYYWNPCHSFSVGTPGAGDELDECKDVAGCQKWYEFYSELGYQSSNLFSYDHNGFYVYYKGNNDQYAPQGRDLFVYLRCDPSVKNAAFVAHGDIQSNKIYIFEVTHQSLCPQSTGASITPGTIMCIIALVAVIGYLVGGIVFMKFVKGAEGKEIIPNVTLWMGIPGLIKDGALFIKSKLTGFKSDANYETL